MGLILGLDLGVTSVGFGIIEEDTYKIVDYGVRLFEEADATNNLTRRSKRGSRRLKSRKKNRINALKYFLLQLGIIDSFDFDKLTNVYELRVKGLYSKLSYLELANVLVHLAKHRGVAYDVAVDENDKEALESAGTLSKNIALLQKTGKFICEIQLEKLQQGEKLRTIENLYPTKEYEKEVRAILSNQSLKADDIDHIVEIIFRKRDFSEGPGSLKFPTPYGSYRLIDNQIQKVNLIEEMRGKCSIYPEEPRIAKNAYKACLFNFLNDLNNLTILKDGEKIKLTEAQKMEFIQYINENGHITPAKLMKKLEVDKNHISGFRVDKNNKPLLTTFDIYEKILKLELDRNFINNKEQVDSVIEVLTKTIVKDKRIQELNDLNLNLIDDDLAKLASIPNVNGYHSLSEKAMDVLIPELLSTSFNQMEIIYKNHLFSKKMNFNGPNIPFDDTAILSPVAKRVHRQALEVVNSLRKEYGEFSSIVIETTRAKNSAEEKKEEIAKQKAFEENKKKSDELLLAQNLNPEKVNTKTRLKLMLYKEQNAKTIYTGEPIDLDRLLNDPTAYEIEHIIPYSISFDNSLNNKALASYKENQDKGNHSPWGYFSSGKVKGPIDTWEKFVAFINGLPNINSSKKANLLNQEDITKYDNRKDFINRNLNDTSYGIRTVMNTITSYFKENSISTKVFTIKGKVTSAFRGFMKLKKVRDDYIHHAIDALIIASFKNQKTFYEAFKLETDEDFIYNDNTGEVLSLTNPLEDNKLLNFIENLKKIVGKPKDFSWKIDTKTNRQFSDETIYSTRTYLNDEVFPDGEYVIKKYKDIYGKEGESLKKKFDEGKANTLLAYRNDRLTYDLLEKIVKSYPMEKNPFAKYKHEEHGEIRKYSKNGQGPIVRQIKYFDFKLTPYNHYDISQNYGKASNKKVVLLSCSAFRIDIYQSTKGEYKFLTIRNYNIKQKDGKNFILDYKYQELKDLKNINEEDVFLFSLYRNNTIRLVDNQRNGFYLFKAIKMDDRNVIELASVKEYSKERITPSIGKTTKLIEKYNVSPTGKYQKVDKETLKLIW